MFVNNYGRIITSDELVHYGIMGMHWGVRRYQPYPSDYHGDGKYTGKTGNSGTGESGAKSSRRERREQKRNYKQAKKERKEEYKKLINDRRNAASLYSIMTMSDAELDRRINRLRKENTYAELVSRSPVNSRTQSKGKKVARIVLGAIGSKIGVPMAVGVTEYGVREKLPNQLGKMKTFQNEDKTVNKDKVNSAVETIMKNVNQKKKK